MKSREIAWGERTMVLLWILGLLLIAGVPGVVSAGDAPGYLGVSVDRLSSQDRSDLGVTHGVWVTDVLADSAADKAGLREGDIIMTVDGEKIRIPRDLVDVIRAAKAGKKVMIRIDRRGKEKEIQVVLGERRPFHGAKELNVPDGKGFLRSHGRGYLGVRLHDLDSDMAGYFAVKADAGALILEVVDKSPARKAGLKSGDVITRVDKTDISCARDVTGAIGEFSAGDEVDITVIRRQKKMVLHAKLAESPFLRTFEFLEDLGKGSKRILLPRHGVRDSHDPGMVLKLDPSGECRVGVQLDGLLEVVNRVRGKIMRRFRQAGPLLTI